MKKSRYSFYFFFLLMYILILYLNGCNTPSRGKIVESDMMDSIRNEAYLNIGSLSIQQHDANADSTGIMEGEMCVWDENTKSSTGKVYLYQPRRFPKNFRFGCNEEGELVRYRMLNHSKYDVIVFIRNEPDK